MTNSDYTIISKNADTYIGLLVCCSETVLQRSPSCYHNVLWSHHSVPVSRRRTRCVVRRSSSYSGVNRSRTGRIRFPVQSHFKESSFIIVDWIRYPLASGNHSCRLGRQVAAKLSFLVRSSNTFAYAEVTNHKTTSLYCLQNIASASLSVFRFRGVQDFTKK